MAAGYRGRPGTARRRARPADALKHRPHVRRCPAFWGCEMEMVLSRSPKGILRLERLLRWPASASLAWVVYKRRTPQISDPAPLAPGIQLRRHRREGVMKGSVNGIVIFNFPSLCLRGTS